MTKPQTTFQGCRLREALRARAIKANALAEMIDVSPSSLSQYESGDRTPSPNVIARLSEVLNLPPHFFTAPPEPAVSSCLRWRSQSAARKAARERAEQKYEWFRRVHRAIESRVELPATNFPVFDSPADPTEIDQEQIEQIAAQVRRYWGLNNGPISNMVQLMENNGCIVVRSEMSDEHLDAFSDLDPKTNRCFIILGTDKRSCVRARHNVAHELAHVLLHRKVPKNVARQTPIHNEMESQADRFASAMLMPPDTFPTEVFSLTLDGLLHLKRRWGASVSSMVMRLASLNLIDDAKKQSFFMQISKRGWRREEPLDDQLPVEQPKLMRRCIDALIQERIIDSEQLAVETKLTPSEIERLLGLEAGHMGGSQSVPQAFQLRLTDQAG